MSSLNLDISLLNNLAEQNWSLENELSKDLDRKNLLLNTQDDPSSLLKKTSFKIRALPQNL